MNTVSTRFFSTTSLSSRFAAKFAVSIAAVLIAGLSGVFAFGVSADTLPRMLFGLAGIAGASSAAPTAGHGLALNEEQSPQVPLVNMASARSGHTATTLSDGRVLIAGGDASGSAEIYDPLSGLFVAAGNLNSARSRHAAVRLADGRILLTGGTVGGASVSSTEIFDPSNSTFLSGPSLGSARSGHTATALAGGNILIAGGGSDSTEIFDGTSFTALAASMNASRTNASAAGLADGRVFIAGGDGLTSAEIFDPADGSFTAAGGAMTVARSRALLRLLPDGKLQIIGGGADGSMEVYDPSIDTIGAYAHVVPESDPCANLINHVLSAETRAALIFGGSSVPDRDRSGHTITELGSSAIVIGGTDSGGNALATTVVYNSSNAKVTTDQLDYAPGDTATISGTGFAAGETVRVMIHEDPHTEFERGFDAVADENGNFSGTYTVQDYDLNMKFVVGARGLTSGKTAQTTFTDSNPMSITVALPTSVTIAQGATASFGDVTVNATGNTQPCNTTLAIAGSLPAGATPIWGSNPLTTTGSSESTTFSISTMGTTPTGTYTFQVSGTNSVPSTGGQCQGGPSITSSGTITLIVTAGTVNTTTTVANASATYGDSSVTLNATVTPASGPAINSGSVTFTVKQGATTIGIATTDTSVVAGAASVSYALPIGTNAGPYTIEASYAPGAGFNASSGTGTLTINVRNATWTTDPNSKTYGDADPSPLTTGSGDFLATDGVTATYARAPGETVFGGPYHITATLSPAAALSNYNITNDGAEFTINKRLATWTTDPNSKTYGDPDPAPLTTGSGSNFVAADNVTATYARVAGEDASPPTYHITATLSATPLSALDNYVITNAGAEFTIEKRPVSVEADPKTKVYGNADPALTYQITSGTLAFSDTFSGSLTRVAGENVGVYAINQGTLTLGPNYDLSYTPANLTITERPITVAADAKTKTFSQPDPPLTYQITTGSLAFSDAFTGALTRDAGELVGNYAINIGTLAINDGNGGNNYTFTYVGAYLTIVTGCTVFDGFKSPIGGAVELGTGGSFMSPVRTFKLNSTIPVKWSATCFNTALVTGVHTLQAIRYSNAATIVGDPIDATPTDAATTGNQFRLTGTEWHFNLDTKKTQGMGEGTWLLQATLYDGSNYTVWITVKK
jgi:hypothetical protein